MKSKKEIAEQFQKHYGISKHGLKNQYRHIEECRAFYVGDYMNYRDTLQYGRGSSRRTKEVSFNRVKPYVNAIVGFFIQNRKKPDYQAVEKDSEQQRAFSDYLNGQSEYIRENTNADQHETKQEKDLVIGGVGVTDTVITLNAGAATRDPYGEIIVSRVDPLEVGWDPAAVEDNLLDSRWVYRCKEYDVDEAEELFDADEDEFEFSNRSDDITNYQFNPYGGIQDKIGYEWADPQRRMVRVYFYQWYEIEAFYRIENPLLQIPDPELQFMLAEALSSVPNNQEDELFVFDPMAEVLTITKDKRAQVRDIFRAFGLPFAPVNHKRKVFYTAVLSGDKVFSAFKSVSQQGFSLKFKTGDRDDINKIWTGVVASMREPQRYYNKALTELMLIIANNSRGGVMYEEDAIDNVQEFEAQWAKYNAAIKVNAGALSGGKIQPKATPQLNTGYENILAVSGENLSSVTGIDESIFGVTGGGNETALLHRQRIKQAATVLASYVDAIELYTKEQARLMLSFMRLLNESSRGRQFPIRGDNGEQIFEQFSPDFFADEYEIKIGEAPETEMQREYFTQTLIEMGTGMQATGDPLYKKMYALALKYMPFPERDKNEIVAALSEERIDPAMVQQMQAQIQAMQSAQAQIEQARAAADIAEKNARVQEILAKAQKTQFETAEVQEDTAQKALENDLLAAVGPQSVNVTI